MQDNVMSAGRWKKALALGAAGVLASGAVMFGCTSNAPATSSASASASASAAADSDVITVEIDDTSCTVSANTAPSGTITFNVTNNGTAVNEFEILAEDQLQIVTERENITPGTTVEVTTQLKEGTYYTASKTNMVGALVDPTLFTVTEGEDVVVSEDEQELMDEAVEMYTAYIKDQAGQLLEATEEFVEVYKAGDDEAAKALYAPTRMFYERIEPTAEAFGDIDPNLDLREQDAKDGDLDDLADWRGWHAIEKSLWEPEAALAENGIDEAKRAELADQLLEDTQELYDLVYDADFEVTLADISNGAISLLEEVMTSKITGEEEAFSHTDLWDFQANVEGAKVAYGNVKDLAEMKDPEAVAEIDKAFAAVEQELAKYQKGTDANGNVVYAYYDELSGNSEVTVEGTGEDGELTDDEKDEALSELTGDIKSLADKVNALRLPLGDLTAIILG